MTTDNPLKGFGAGRPGRVTLEMLEDMAETLNRYPWVTAIGKPYFVNRRVDESGVKHFLDRKI